MKKVIWAVDPFVDDKTLQFTTFKAVVSLIGNSDVAIEPVSVLSPDQLKIPREAFQGNAKTFQLESQKILAGWAKELGDKRITAPQFLVLEGMSTNASINALVRYAHESKADLVALGTHNKKTLERFLVGSFAETMMLKCDVPLLVVNPKSPVRQIAHILFPTDFSDSSRKAFEVLLPTAKTLGAKLTLYYKFEYLVPDTIAIMKVTPDYDRYWRADKEARRRAATQWVEAATKLDVKVDVILDEKPSFIAEGILSTAKKEQADLIAMASTSGAVMAALLGSVARQVVRAAEVPVWIMHQKK